jgi:hypothetical protein
MRGWEEAARVGVAEQNAPPGRADPFVSPWPNRAIHPGVLLLPVSPSPNRTRSDGVRVLGVSPWPNRSGHLVAPLLPVSPWPNRTPLLAIPVLAASLSANTTGLAETATPEMFAQGDIRSSPRVPA